MRWIKKSNRMSHFWAGLFLGWLFTILGSIIGAFYKEIVDKRRGGKFDYLDILATILGGIVGSIIPLLTFFTIKLDGLGSGLIFYFSVPLSLMIMILCLGGKSQLKSILNEIIGLYKV